MNDPLGDHAASMIGIACVPATDWMESRKADGRLPDLANVCVFRPEAVPGRPWPVSTDTIV